MKRQKIQKNQTLKVIEQKSNSNDTSDDTVPFITQATLHTEQLQPPTLESIEKELSPREHYLAQMELESYDLLIRFRFIKSLPPQTHQPPPLLPKKTRSSPQITLVLDLDETLVHCNTHPIENADLSFPVEFNGVNYQVMGNVRPHCIEFLKKCATKFEVVLFTASQKLYADQLANILDPCHSWFKFRLFRDACTFVQGNYIKDLSVLGRDLSKTIIVDNSPQAFGYHIDNGIPIKSWYADIDDSELLKVLEFLETLTSVPDVRPYIKQKYGLEAKIKRSF